MTDVGMIKLYRKDVLSVIYDSGREYIYAKTNSILIMLMHVFVQMQQRVLITFATVRTELRDVIKC